MLAVTTGDPLAAAISQGDSSARPQQRCVVASTQQYRAAIGQAMAGTGTISGARLNELRDGDVSGASSSLAHGIGLVGARQVAGRAVVTFAVDRQFGGGWHEGRAQHCYRVELHPVGEANSDQ